MNIVLVVFDTLRKDCAGAYGSPSWGEVHVPHFEAFAAQSVVMTKAYPNVLPTLPARVALYTGLQVYPFAQGDVRLKGDFVGAPGWGPIPEDSPTLAETLSHAGYRTALISDVYHMFKPSKNFWRGFDQWSFLRGQEIDPARSGPHLSERELAHWLPPELRGLGALEDRPGELSDWATTFVQQCVMNLHDRTHEVDYFAPRVFREAARWLEENQDADRFFLTVDCFDPHEPWLVPAHYRRLYQAGDGPEQVITFYDDVSAMPAAFLDRTRANYRGAVTQCDRWFGYFMETLRVLGRLDDTAVILVADHGHTLGEAGYMGKRGYPSRPEVFDIPLMVRLPGAEHAGTICDHFVQHVDVSASILDAAGVEPERPLDGRSFVPDAVGGGQGSRDHVTVGWGSTPTVVDKDWWFNCKCDGTGVLLYDLKARDLFARNVADVHRSVVDALFGIAKDDAGGGFPDWLLELARNEADAPGCSLLAVRA